MRGLLLVVVVALLLNLCNLADGQGAVTINPNYQATQTTIYFTWTPATGGTVSGYQVAMNYEWHNGYAVSAGVTGFTYSQLTPGTSYYIGVMTKPSGATANMFMSTLAAPTPAPTIPSAPTVTPNSDNYRSVSMGLLWDPPSSGTFDGYRVYRNNNLLATLGKVTYYVDYAVTAGQTYTYEIAAYNAAGESSRSSWGALLCPYPPNAPRNFRITTKTNNNIQLAWDKPATGGTAYMYYQIFKDGSKTQINNLETLTYSYSVTPNTRYTFIIKSMTYNGDVSSTFPTIINSTKTNNPTGMTQDLAATTSTMVSMSWSPPGFGAFGYRVYRSGEYLGATTKLSYNDSTPVPGKEYNYFVKAINEDYVESGSTSQLMTTIPPKPINFRAGSGTNGTAIELLWDLPGTTEAYLFRSGGEYHDQETAMYPKMSRIVYPLIPGEVFPFWVFSEAKNGLVSTSVHLTASTVPLTPDTAVVAYSSSSVELQWSPPDGFRSGYNVYRDGVKIAVLSEGNHYYPDSTPAPAGKTFMYFVAARTDYGQESPYNPFPVTLLSNPPTGVTTGTVTHNSISISWGNPIGLYASFNVYCNIGTAWLVTNYDNSVHEHTQTGLEGGKSYTFRLASVNSAGIPGFNTTSLSITTLVAPTPAPTPAPTTPAPTPAPTTPAPTTPAPTTPAPTTPAPTPAPTQAPTPAPTTPAPTTPAPTPAPTDAPTPASTGVSTTPAPTPEPTNAPTPASTGVSTTPAPTPEPTDAPTPASTGVSTTPAPTPDPTNAPTPASTGDSTTPAPTNAPTPASTGASTTPAPTPEPTDAPTPASTGASTTPAPTNAPTPASTGASTTPAPTPEPTDAPTPASTGASTTPAPTNAPTPASTTPAPTTPVLTTSAPTPGPTQAPTPAPTTTPTPSSTGESTTPAPATPAPTPSTAATGTLTNSPTNTPTTTSVPTNSPQTNTPTTTPTSTNSPTTKAPTNPPTTKAPTNPPTNTPTTKAPTNTPTTKLPTIKPNTNTTTTPTTTTAPTVPPMVKVTVTLSVSGNMSEFNSEKFKAVISGLFSVPASNIEIIIELIAKRTTMAQNYRVIVVFTANNTSPITNTTTVTQVIEQAKNNANSTLAQNLKESGSTISTVNVDAAIIIPSTSTTSSSGDAAIISGAISQNCNAYVIISWIAIVTVLLLHF